MIIGFHLQCLKLQSQSITAKPDELGTLSGSLRPRAFLPVSYLSSLHLVSPLTSCTVHAAGKPTFQISAVDMEIGVGIHGEPGRRRVPLAAADEIVAESTNAVIKDLSLRAGQ
jgi:Dak1 domain